MQDTKGIASAKNNYSSVSTGKSYLLTIGIDIYDFHRSLSNAVADATAFAQVMTNRYGFLLLQEPLYNEQATQKKIRKALGVCESLEENDRLIVFYSGHGWYKKSAKLGYLVPTDAEDDPNSDFISVTHILDVLRSVKAHHILLIIDCCFGGSFGEERNVLGNEKQYIADLDSKKSRMVLSSGGIEPVSDGLITDNNSPFTKNLTEFLNGNNEQIVFSDFFSQLRKKVRWNANQLPQYKVLHFLGHNGGELVLTPRINASFINLKTAIDKAISMNLPLMHSPFHRPFQFIGMTIPKIEEILSVKANSVGNLVLENNECRMFLEAEGNFICYIEIEFKKTKPHDLCKEFDSEPLLGALSISISELELIRTQTHFHTYYDHMRKLKVGVHCAYDGAPLSVSFSSKYYGM